MSSQGVTGPFGGPSVVWRPRATTWRVGASAPQLRRAERGPLIREVGCASTRPLEASALSTMSSMSRPGWTGFEMCAWNPALRCQLRVLRASVSRQRDGLGSATPSTPETANASHERVAIHPRHRDVADDDVRSEFLEHPDRGVRRRCAQDDRSLVAENAREQLTAVVVVVDDEHGEPFDPGRAGRRAVGVAWHAPRPREGGLGRQLDGKRCTPSLALALAP